MSAKTNAEVVIDGKVYTLSGYENEEYLQKDVYEPYLVKNGFINRTPKGRVATELAFEHFERKKA